MLRCWVELSWVVAKFKPDFYSPLNIASLVDGSVLKFSGVSSNSFRYCVGLWQWCLVFLFQIFWLLCAKIYVIIFGLNGDECCPVSKHTQSYGWKSCRENFHVDIFSAIDYVCLEHKNLSITMLDGISLHYEFSVNSEKWKFSFCWQSFVMFDCLEAPQVGSKPHRCLCQPDCGPQVQW